MIIKDELLTSFDDPVIIDIDFRYKNRRLVCFLAQLDDDRGSLKSHVFIPILFKYFMYYLYALNKKTHRINRVALIPILESL